MKTERLNYLDMAKGIGIILVVIGHSGLGSEGLVTWLTSFHMPLFMIISGMLLFYKKEEEQPFSHGVKKKFFSIMIPYAAFSVIFLLLSLFELHRLAEGYWTVSILQITSFYGLSVLWFLPALFMGETLFLYLRIKTSRRVTALCSLAVCALALFIKELWSGFDAAGNSLFSLWLDYFMTALIRGGIAVMFISIGYFTMYLLSKRALSRRLCLLLFLAFFGINYAVSFLNGKTDLRFMIFNNPFLYFAGAVSGSMAIVCLCKALPSLKLLSYLGENSLIIMVTHLDCYIMLLGLQFAHFINLYITHAKQYIFYLNLTLALLAMETLLIYIINHVFPFLLGKHINSHPSQLFSRFLIKPSKKTTPAKQ